MKRCIFSIFTTLVFFTSSLYALSPSTKVANRSFRKEFFEAARMIRSGNIKNASEITGLSKERLQFIAASVRDFSIEVRDLPQFQTELPLGNVADLNRRVDEFLDRDMRYPLLKGKDKPAFREHIFCKTQQVDNFLNKQLGHIMSCWGINSSDVKGVFVRGGWLWHGLSTGETFLFHGQPGDLDLFIIVDDAWFNHADMISLRTGLGPDQVHVHYIREGDFLRGGDGNVTYLKLLAYRGVQVRGPLYFHMQKANFTHLIIFANNLLGEFLKELTEEGDIEKAKSRLREAQAVLSYIALSNGRKEIDLKSVWDLLNQKTIYPNECDNMLQLLLSVLLNTKEAILESLVAEKIRIEVESSV